MLVSWKKTHMEYYFRACKNKSRRLARMFNKLLKLEERVFEKTKKEYRKINKWYVQKNGHDSRGRKKEKEQ